MERAERRRPGACKGLETIKPGTQPGLKKVVGSASGRLWVVRFEQAGLAGAQSGPCTLTLNGKTDKAATYQADSSKLTITTTLNAEPIDIYTKQSGTQVDNISGHNLWIG